MLQHQTLKHEALEHGQAVPALKGATMNNCCSSVLLERLCYVSARMAEGDADVKCSVLSAQQNGNAERRCTVLSMFWDRNSQRKLNFDVLHAYLMNYFFFPGNLPPFAQARLLILFCYLSLQLLQDRCTPLQEGGCPHLTELLPCGERPQAAAKCPHSHFLCLPQRESCRQPDEYS